MPVLSQLSWPAADEFPSSQNKVVITGVSPASIGATTALAVASQAPQALILASRTASKMDAVAADIADKHPNVVVHKVALDLSSLDSVKAAAAQIDGLVDRVDVLINNAGINSATRSPVQTPGDTTVDLTFMTNHLGPFLFTHLLTPKLRAASLISSPTGVRPKTKGATRVVNLSSHGHRLSPVRFYDYQLAHYVYDGVPESQKPPRALPEGFLMTHPDDGYANFIGYGQSKTANILHATELARRFRHRGDDVLALSLHPGAIRTELSRSMTDEAFDVIFGTAPPDQWKTPDQGAATTVVAAFDPKLGELDVGGAVVGYLSDCQLADEWLAEWAKDPYNAQMLYHESERMLGTRTGLAPVPQ